MTELEESIWAVMKEIDRIAALALDKEYRRTYYSLNAAWRKLDDARKALP